MPATQLFMEPVLCGGVFVRPGDIVLADDNGVLFLDAGTARRSDRPGARIGSRGARDACPARAGEPLREVLSFAASPEHSRD